MSKVPEPLAGMEMPAFKKAPPAQLDLMRPGNGTPWEDRGTSGVIIAYFKTVIHSLHSPGLLMDHIGRPEASADAQSFTIVNASIWALAMLLNNAWWLYVTLPKHPDDYTLDNPMQFWVTAFLQAGLVGGGVFLWTRSGAEMFKAMAGDELKKVTSSLVYNCFSYALGPSLLALIPNYGWAVAFVWIVFNQFVAAKRRLYMKTVSAVINTLLIAICVAGSAAVLYFFLGWLWCSHLEMNGIIVIEHKPAAPSPYQHH